MVWSSPSRAGRLSPRAGRLPSLLLIGALALGGILSPVSLAPEAAATAAWRTGPDFNGTGCSFESCWVNGTGAGARLELVVADDWVKRTNAGPTARSYHSLCTIANDDTILLFGGMDDNGMLDETWVYDAGSDRWTKRGPATSPQARYVSSLAMVPNDDKAVLYGGSAWWEYFNDTWVYDMSDDEWRDMAPAASPPARYYHKMAPIYNDDKMVLFGGEDINYDYFNDTWLYDVGDNTWTELSLSSHPSARGAHAMATVWGDDKVVLYGGDGPQGPITDTWTFDLSDSRWTELSPASTPVFQRGPELATIFNDDKLLLFGGRDNRTSLFDASDGEWQTLDTPHSPPARFSMSLATVFGTAQAVIFGGYDYQWNTLSDTWMFYPSARSPTAEYLSPYKDTGGNSTYMSIEWNATVPPGTGLRFQMRSADNQFNLTGKKFIGPSGSHNSYYTEPDVAFYGHNGDHIVQFKAYLNTSDIVLSPSLADVTIKYNRYPFAPNLTAPLHGVWLNVSRPLFKWTFNDTDSPVQAGFELELGRLPDPERVNFTTGQQSSDNSSYLSEETLEEGAWYWHVRTQDQEGDWGPYSAFRSFSVDVTLPKAFIPWASPADWTSEQPLVYFGTWDEPSGIDRYELWMDGKPLGAKESPYPLPVNTSDGVRNFQIRAYDKAGNYIDGRTKVYYDRTSPLPFNLSTSAPNWSRADPEISFSATDAASGIDYYELCLDHGSFTRQKSPFVAAGLSDGPHDILVRAVDKAGNFRDANMTFQIDRTAPEGLYVTVSPAGWTSAPPVVDYYAYDEASELDRYEVKLDGGPFFVSAPPFIPANMTDGAHTVTVRAVDLAGNHAEMDAQFYIDATPPNPFTPAAEPANWTRFDPSVTFSTGDNSSGVDRYELSIDGERFFKERSPALIGGLPDGEHLIVVRAFDKAGNFIDGAVKVFIDRSPPEQLAMGVNGGRQTTGGRTVQLAISAQDPLSGLDLMAFSNDGLAYTDWESFSPNRTWKLTSGAGDKTVYVKVRDRIGNEARPASAMITYLPPAPPPSITVPLAMVGLPLLLVAAVAAFVYMRRRMRKSANK